MLEVIDMETHTQNMIVVYVTDAEKAEIKLSAKKKGMSRYLLDLHLENKRNLTSRRSRAADSCTHKNSSYNIQIGKYCKDCGKEL